MIPTRDKALIKKIGVPSSQELKGRVGYVRLVNKGKLDVTIITAYIPVEGQDRELSGKNMGLDRRNHNEARKLFTVFYHN